MRAKDKERLARRQRMLARERGEPLPDVFAPPSRGRSRPKGADPDPEPPLPDTPAPAPQAAAGETGRTARLRPLSPILRRRRRRRRLTLLAGLAAVTGALRSAVALAPDAAASAYLYLHRGSGWPASTGIDSPLRIEELAGGFVEMDSRDVAVYSAYGSQIRTIQPGYARPALAVGNTRFVLYDRAGTSLRVESRTRILHTRTTSEAILLCALSANGTVAVVTESDRYVAQLQVLDPTSFEPLYTWKMTQEEGIPLAVAFAPDNRRFAVGTVAARDGQLASSVCLTGISGQEEPLLYTAESGSMLVRLHWLSGSRLLAVFDTYAALLDPAGRAHRRRAGPLRLRRGGAAGRLGAGRHRRPAAVHPQRQPPDPAGQRPEPGGRYRGRPGGKRDLYRHRRLPDRQQLRDLLRGGRRPPLGEGVRRPAAADPQRRPAAALHGRPGGGPGGARLRPGPSIQ